MDIAELRCDGATYCDPFVSHAAIEFVISRHDKHIIPGSTAVIQKVAVGTLLWLPHVTCENQNRCDRLEECREDGLITQELQMKIGCVLHPEYTTAGGSEKIAEQHILSVYTSTLFIP
jgi:hypothetical protein